jgi:hypothetical protein
MPRFSQGLTGWAEQFKHPVATITPGESSRLQMEIDRLGDRYLAETYNNLGTTERLSPLADLLERAIIDRYLQHNLMLAFS